MILDRGNITCIIICPNCCCIGTNIILADKLIGCVVVVGLSSPKYSLSWTSYPRRPQIYLRPPCLNFSTLFQGIHCSLNSVKILQVTQHIQYTCNYRFDILSASISMKSTILIDLNTNQNKKATCNRNGIDPTTCRKRTFVIIVHTGE